MRKNYLKVSTIVVLILHFCLYTNIANAQEDHNHLDPDTFNLPPGAVFHPKAFQEIDYSYKLSQDGINSVEKDFMYEFTDQEIIELKTVYKEDYKYFKAALEYFDCLSDKVMQIYTVDELWYIYKFDQKLKEKLKTIK